MAARASAVAIAVLPLRRSCARRNGRNYEVTPPSATRAPAAPAPIGPAVMSSAGTVVKTRAAVTLVRRAAAAGAPAAELQRVGAASGAPKGLQTPPARRTHTAAAAARRPLGTRAARRRAAPRSPFAPRASACARPRRQPPRERRPKALSAPSARAVRRRGAARGLRTRPASYRGAPACSNTLGDRARPFVAPEDRFPAPALDPLPARTPPQATRTIY